MNSFKNDFEKINTFLSQNHLSLTENSKEICKEKLNELEKIENMKSQNKYENTFKKFFEQGQKNE